MFKTSKILIFILLIVLSITFTLLFLAKYSEGYYLKSDDKAEDLLEACNEEYNLDISTSEIEYLNYKTGLGDWQLNIYYLDGNKEMIIFRDNEAGQLRSYIDTYGIKGGNFGKTFFILAICNMLIIIFCIIKNVI